MKISKFFFTEHQFQIQIITSRIAFGRVDVPNIIYFPQSSDKLFVVFTVSRRDAASSLYESSLFKYNNAVKKNNWNG